MYKIPILVYILRIYFKTRRKTGRFLEQYRFIRIQLIPYLWRIKQKGIEMKSTTVIILLAICVSSIKANNIAFGKPTKQLTTGYSGTSDNAVDGNFKEWSSGVLKCTHSSSSTTSGLRWWAVDLKGHYKITHVLTYGRNSTCCSSWLKNYDIDAIEHPKLFGDKWATFQKGKTSHCHYQQPSLVFLNATCPPDVKGRFVRIRKRSNDSPLCLCEVEVYGNLITYSEESNPLNTKAYGFPGKVYNGILLQKMFARSNIECTSHCIRHMGCCAGIYNKVTKECSLMRKSDNNEETTHSFHEDDDCSSFLI